MEIPQNMPVEERLVEEIKQEPEDFANTESYIRHYFADLPVLVDIAFCESRFRQTDEQGVILRGKVNRRDIGVMQINLDYHERDAKKSGLDLTTLEGNVSYARELYEKQGTDPWVYSSKCWKKSPVSELALK